ncbi:MAG TPA: hypothetical protein VFG69_02470 [Nannocystaceae bacterium]|nr:hypothetical protein [Nannocystaceae bacterium]
MGSTRCSAGWLALVVACGDANSDDGNDEGASADDGTSNADDGTSNDDGDSSDDGPADDTGVPSDCTIFPADNPWNTDISAFPVHANSDAFIAAIGLDTGMHADFGTEWEGAPIGIPWVVVPADQPRVPVTFEYDDSDPGPYPIPPDAPIEGGPDADGDRHIIALDLDDCRLYELFAAYTDDGGASWSAGSGAIFDLRSNDLRPEGWTSADAAGLPIFPGLVRYEEVVEQGAIEHALRFTVSSSQRGYIHPATHFASDDTNPDLPPMGLRVRMKADYDCSGLASEIQVICTALKRYGMFVADNGSDWYLSGAPHPMWNDDNLHDIDGITGAAFEVVETGTIVTE